MTTRDEAWEQWYRPRLPEFPNRPYWEGVHEGFNAGWEAAMEEATSGTNGVMMFETAKAKAVSEARVIPSRNTDPETSHAAAKKIVIKAGTQRAYLLKAFSLLPDATDEEAMEIAYPMVLRGSEYSKRCSELREAGFIEPTGDTRIGSAGVDRIVSRITQKGLDSL